MKNYFVYIATNQGNTVLYTGVTNNIERRTIEHKEKLLKGFTSRYNVNKIIYINEFKDINEAIAIEKKIKGWTRIKKINLIKSINPGFKDLFK